MKRREGFACVVDPDEQDSVATSEIRLDLFQAPLNQILPARVETCFISLQDYHLGKQMQQCNKLLGCT